MKKLLPFLLLPFVFSSCVYVQRSDDFNCEQKTTYKSFESLKEPLVLSYDYKLNFDLYGNEALNSSVIHNGSILMIYDCENDKVFDYVYAPGITGDSVLKAPVSAVCDDGITKFYSADYDYNVVYELASDKTELSEIALDKVKKSYGEYGWADNRGIYSKYLINYYPDSYVSDGSDKIIKLNVLDCSAGEFKAPIDLQIYSGTSMRFAYCQADNSYWISYSTRDYENNTYYFDVRRIDCAENKLDDVFITLDCYEGQTYDENTGWSDTYNYRLYSVNDEYLVFGKTSDSNNDVEQLITVSKTDKSIKDYNLKLPDYCSINDVLCINNEFYILCKDDEYKPGNIHVLRLNPKNDEEVTFLTKIAVSNYYETTVRGSRIYFVKYPSDETEKSFFYLDINDLSVSEEKTVKLSDFVEKE